MTFFLLHIVVVIVLILIHDVVSQCPVASAYMNDVERSAFAASLVSSFPTLVSRFSIGKSQQNRSIEGIKISDSNDPVGELEPAIKFVANIHGNEVVGNHLVAQFACHLLTQYTNNNQTIRALVDSTEIYLVLSFNPDGFATNQRTTTSFVDLNRAFPDNFVDPDDTCDGRPIEVCAMMNWLRANQFVLSAHFHGGALVVNYPRDGRPDGGEQSQAVVSEDDALFQSIARTYADRNPAILSSAEFPSTRGITNGATWYPIYGGVQDYCYIWHDHYDFTIEVSLEKHPAGASLPGFWAQNRDSMIAFSQRAHGGIKGVVLDNVSGTPIVGATVRVVGTGRDSRTRTARGSFFRLLLPGTYTVQFWAPGYNMASIASVVVTASGSTQMAPVRLMRNGSPIALTSTTTMSTSDTTTKTTTTTAAAATTTTTTTTTTAATTTTSGGNRVAETTTATMMTQESSSSSAPSSSSTSTSLYDKSDTDTIDSSTTTTTAAATTTNPSSTPKVRGLNTEMIVVDSQSNDSQTKSLQHIIIFMLTMLWLQI
jgi:hypothetical protein